MYRQTSKPNKARLTSFLLVSKASTDDFNIFCETRFAKHCRERLARHKNVTYSKIESLTKSGSNRGIVRRVL